MSVSLQDVDFGEQHIIYVSDPPNPSTAEWTAPATEFLLKLLKKYMGIYQNGKLKKKRYIYDCIEKEMKLNDFNYQAPQCENRWKTLKRAYLRSYEKPSGTNKRKRSSELHSKYIGAVEDLLVMERPEFQQELEEVHNSNLNLPPGFQSYNAVKSEIDENDQYDSTENYYDNDDLVQSLLEGDDTVDEETQISDSELENHIEKVPGEEKANIFYFKKTPDKHIPNSNVSNENNLASEISELKEVIKKSLNTNTQILKSTSDTNEQILSYLENLEKKEQEQLELKKKKLEKQTELIQQMKIQNSLIAKLIQKLGN